MMFHIRCKPLNDKRTYCGLDLEEVYRTLDQSLGAEVQIENRPHWFPGDHVCLPCIRRARPTVVKQLLACADIRPLEWVVLCGCGGVRPYGKPCGHVDPQNPKRLYPPVDLYRESEERAGNPPSSKGWYSKP